MNISELRMDAAIKGKNGVAFIMAAIVVWLAITIIFLQPIELYTKNVLLFVSTGFLFPIALMMSHFIKADWQLKHNPLSKLGLFFNLAQFMYFPLVFWAFIQSPPEMVIFFAVIAGAHFFPYGWYYEAQAYYVMAPVIAISIIVVGWTIEESYLWITPLMMVIFLAVMVMLLVNDYKKKNSE